MCQALSVSENGYYNWRTRGKSQRKRDDEQLVTRIEDAYYKSGGTYGSPRIHQELKEQGIHCGRKRVARLMREKQLIVGLDPNNLLCSLCPQNGREAGFASKIHHDWRLRQVDQLEADIQENIRRMRTRLIVQSSFAGPDIDGF